MLDLCVHAPGTATVWTNQPAAVTELLGLTAHRNTVDLSAYTEARVVADIPTVAANAGAVLAAQYSILGDFTDAAYFNVAGSGPEVAIDATGVTAGSWAALDAAALAAVAAGDVAVRVVGEGGDGAVDPTIGRVSVQFR